MRVSSPPSEPSSALHPIGGHARDVVPQRFRERLERHAELLVAATPQHRRADARARAARARSRAASCRCPARPTRAPRAVRPRPSPSTRARSVSYASRGPRTGNQARCRRTREAAQRSSRPAPPLDVAHRDRRGQALQLAAAERLDGELAARPGERAHEIAHEDLAAGGRAHSRDASTTGVPNQSPSSNVASPALMPTRISSRRPSSRRLWRSTARCIATAAGKRVGRALVRHHHRVADRLDLGAARRRDRPRGATRSARGAVRRPPRHRVRTRARSNRRDR